MACVLTADTCSVRGRTVGLDVINRTRSDFLVDRAVNVILHEYGTINCHGVLTVSRDLTVSYCDLTVSYCDLIVSHSDLTISPNHLSQSQ